ncbi:hypothetical protein K503DRAFT_618450 [Rhizopogon vinicolor AM-OR11-026]|uniref:DUF6535 domain-containing protein n=1 Tax=Rhizopogon vinicolor AM-OR11-026 TaxID=1314800 RepID=A0A1B7MID2_9AGAM|nr:hypothetical protein K503DRAFT_618450 [Rhizopogon vinicolor AM-OR11-026]
MTNSLEQILRSTDAEDRGKDVESKFWSTYEKVSNEYDNDFLERANNDMVTVLTFAGLFSIANTIFIVELQPKPIDTMNVLALQLIKMANDPNAVNEINNLLSSITYASSTVWDCDRKTMAKLLQGRAGRSSNGKTMAELL